MFLLCNKLADHRCKIYGITAKGIDEDFSWEDYSWMATVVLWERLALYVMNSEKSVID
jgi:hypothetical protein